MSFKISAVNLSQSLEGLPVLNCRSVDTTEEEASAAFATLAEYEDGGVFAGRFNGTSPWERHSNGDELVQILDGSATVTVLTADGPQILEMTAGMLTIVPRGCWHRFEAPEGVTVMTKTPQPTDHTWDDDIAFGKEKA